VGTAEATTALRGVMVPLTVDRPHVRRGPKIAFQLLFYPVTDANFETGSYTKFQDGPWLTKSAMEWFWNAYLPDKAARKEISWGRLSWRPRQ
jgi:acetyl esterase/lipase